MGSLKNLKNFALILILSFEVYWGWNLINLIAQMSPSSSKNLKCFWKVCPQPQKTSSFEVEPADPHILRFDLPSLIRNSFHLNPITPYSVSVCLIPDLRDSALLLPTLHYGNYQQNLSKKSESQFSNICGFYFFYIVAKTSNLKCFSKIFFLVNF